MCDVTSNFGGGIRGQCHVQRGVTSQVTSGCDVRSDGDVSGDVSGDVRGDVRGDISGDFRGCRGRRVKDVASDGVRMSRVRMSSPAIMAVAAWGDVSGDVNDDVRGASAVMSGLGVVSKVMPGVMSRAG